MILGVGERWDFSRITDNGKVGEIEGLERGVDGKRYEVVSFYVRHVFTPEHSGYRRWEAVLNRVMLCEAPFGSRNLQDSDGIGI
ncbi:hypothetical protein Tco_1196212 [Tanacetum coccineum]